jgi:hypothetical protein
MNSEEMITAVNSVKSGNDLAFYSHGNKLIFKEIANGISMLSIQSQSNETIIMVPYDKAEEDGHGNVMLTFNDTIRGIMNPKGVNKIWGL